MITAGQIRAARGLLNINQAELAEKIGINKATISRIEKDEESLETAEAGTLKKIQKGLEAEGIIFMTPKEENGNLTIGLKQIIKVK